jgi:ribose 5-phosphate isomerase A
MNLKKEAALHALTYVQNGMTMGLGTGSTTTLFIEMLGESLQQGILQDIQAVPTSEKTADLARTFNIPLTSLEKEPQLDLAIDGADDVDPHLNLIKGLGRALLREKIVEIHAQRFIVVVDESKLVTRLGDRSPLPIEIVTFQSPATIRWLNTLGCRAEQWHEDDGSPVITDNGNFLVRCWFEAGIPDPYNLARALADRPGVVEHGLFLDMASLVIVAGSDGTKILERDT